MPALVLTPCEFSAQQTSVNRGHFRCAIIVPFSSVASAKKTEDRSGRDSGYVTALLVEPVGIAALRYAIADEREPRGAQSDQHMRIHREVARVSASER